jgi:phosphopantothenoylcysteine decarboxylase/phosphopantothenate--cysteine ligase
LCDELIAVLQPKLLVGRRVMVTAGPTFEAIDPVRGITNLSSGKMGFALAQAAREAGAKVTLVAGPTSLGTPRGVRRIDVQTAQQMFDEVLAYVDHAQIFVSVAAVADWRVANVSKSKLKKTRGTPPALEFTPNPDILARVAALPNPPYCVGFAAESDNVIENARAKLASKGIPLVIANRAQDALGAEDNELQLIDGTSVMPLPRDRKLAQARRIVAQIAQRIGR